MTSLLAETAPPGKGAGQPFQLLRALARQVLEVRAPTDPAQRKQVWKAACAELRVERREAEAFLRGSGSVRRASYRARRRMARDAGAWIAWIAASVFYWSPRYVSNRRGARSIWWWLIAAWVLSHILTEVATMRH